MIKIINEAIDPKYKIGDRDLYFNHPGNIPSDQEAQIIKVNKGPYAITYDVKWDDGSTSKDIPEDSLRRSYEFDDDE